jgi:hypothetical protein
MKKSFLVAFNKQLKELIDKLNIMIPNNEDLEFAKNMFHVPIMTKENIYLVHFYEHAKPHEEHIMTKNEDFFINFDISELFHVTPDLSDKHNEAKHIWSNFDPQSKNALWQYVQVLFKLAKKYYS